MSLSAETSVLVRGLPVTPAFSQLFVHLATNSWPSQLQADMGGDHIANTAFCWYYLPIKVQGEDLRPS